MKKETEIFEDFINLIQLVDIDKKYEPVFTDEAIALIYKLADEAKETNTYKKASEKDHEWLKAKSPAKLYQYMCMGIRAAYTHTHRITAPVILMPLLAEALKREETVKKRKSQPKVKA